MLVNTRLSAPCYRLETLASNLAKSPCPSFEFDAAKRMVDAWNAKARDGEEYQARYDAGEDAFYFRDGDLEEWDCFGAKTIEAEGKTIKVYPIGAFCWIWSDAESS